MAKIDDFVSLYQQLKLAEAVTEEHKGTLKNLEAAVALGSVMEKATGQKVNLQEDSARTRQAKTAAEFYKKFQKDILDYTKNNLDDIVGGSDEDRLIYAASFGMKPGPDKSELQSYLYAYRITGLLKEENEELQDEENGSKKKKRRIPGDLKHKLIDYVLPLIVKEKIRGKVQEKDLDFYAQSIAYVAALSDKEYLANALYEGQELLKERIKKIGGIKGYIKDNLKEDEDYLSFALGLGEASEKK